jgi:hypothetical protein
MRRLLTTSGLAAAAAVVLIPLAWSEAERPPSTSDCERESQRLFGITPVRFGANGTKPKVTEPRKLRDAKPDLPAQWPKDCRGTVSVHEALIGPSGKVERVWTLKAPCKQVDEAATVAIRNWEFTPTVVEGTPVPACMVVTTLVHLR